MVVNGTWCCCMRSSLFLAPCFNLFPPFSPIFPHFPPFPPIFPHFPCFPIFLRVHYRVHYVPPWPGDSPPCIRQADQGQTHDVWVIRVTHQSHSEAASVVYKMVNQGYPVSWLTGCSSLSLRSNTQKFPRTLCFDPCSEFTVFQPAHPPRYVGPVSIRSPSAGAISFLVLAW